MSHGASLAIGGGQVRNVGVAYRFACSDWRILDMPVIVCHAQQVATSSRYYESRTKRRNRPPTTMADRRRPNMNSTARRTHLGRDASANGARWYLAQGS